MRLRHVFLVSLAGMAAGCATVIHGPYQDVRVESDPPGAVATVSAMGSPRGPAFLDDKKRGEFVTPATVRLRRDNAYRVELLKEGYKVAFAKLEPSYDWLWSPLGCSPCEAIGELPTFDTKGRMLPLRFLNALYEYPKSGIGAFGYTLRMFSPDALLGNAFKLKAEDACWLSGWHSLGTPTASARLEQLD